jgi:hypothetical protein
MARLAKRSRATSERARKQAAVEQNNLARHVAGRHTAEKRAYLSELRRSAKTPGRTTPGASKWYRSNNASAEQHLHFSLEEDAVLEWLPRESIFFDDSRVTMNPAATFSPELSDLTLYVIDVGAGDKIPRKGSPGITKSDLLVINKIDLAPHVGASLETMERDARKMRPGRPFVFTNMKAEQGLATVLDFIETEGLLRMETR